MTSIDGLEASAGKLTKTATENESPGGLEASAGGGHGDFNICSAPTG